MRSEEAFRLWLAENERIGREYRGKPPQPVLENLARLRFTYENLKMEEVGEDRKVRLAAC